MSDDDNVRSLDAARFGRITNPAAHKAVTALEAAMEWVRSLDDAPNHIIVLIGRDMPDGSSGTRFFQAGDYRYHAQYGLCHEGAVMIRESASQ